MDCFLDAFNVLQIFDDVGREIKTITHGIIISRPPIKRRYYSDKAPIKSSDNAKTILSVSMAGGSLQEFLIVFQGNLTDHLFSDKITGIINSGV
jgi:hypothetical protein